MNKTIEVSNIYANYNKFALQIGANNRAKNILNGASFVGYEKECIGILGYNGCGKSTLLSILSGINKPKDGTITYFDKVLCDKKKHIYEKKDFSKYVGYVPQENPLIPELSVYDNLKLWFPSKQTLDESLESGFLHTLGVHTYVKKNVNQLSGGMKKRISIGIATINNPPILILDEPSAALDLACKEDIKEYLHYYKEQGNNIIITTHEDNELDLCDRIYVIKNGKMNEIKNNLRGQELVKVF